MKTFGSCESSIINEHKTNDCAGLRLHSRSMLALLEAHLKFAEFYNHSPLLTRSWEKKVVRIGKYFKGTPILILKSVMMSTLHTYGRRWQWSYDEGQTQQGVKLPPGEEGRQLRGACRGRQLLDFRLRNKRNFLKSHPLFFSNPGETTHWLLPSVRCFDRSADWKRATEHVCTTARRTGSNYPTGC